MSGLEVWIGARGAHDGFNAEYERVQLPFSGYEFLYRKSDWIRSVLGLEVFQRQKRIAQLQQLIPESLFENSKCKVPFFPHTQYDHVLPMGFMAITLLRRAGFSEQVQRKVACAAWFHDFASPALRDVGMRLNKKALSEERNFSNFMRTHCVVETLAKHCNLDVDEMQQWIDGGGEFGMLIDVLDKISYCALDAFYACSCGCDLLEQWRLAHPDALSVWMCMLVESGRVVFTNAKMLYEFLVLRGLLHTQLYWNPNCRVAEHAVFHDLKRLYDAGFITEEQLQRHDDAWVYEKLLVHGSFIDSNMTLNPGAFGWKYFSSKESCDEFCKNAREKIIYQEEIRFFKTGLDWLVRDGREVKPLEELIGEEEKNFLRRLSQERSGWYAYFHT